MRVTRLEVVFLSFFKNHIKYHFFKRIFLGPIYIPISKPGHNILGHQNMRYRLASLLPPPLINCMGHPEALPLL